MSREVLLRGGPQDGQRVAVGDGTNRVVFQTTEAPQGVPTRCHAPSPDDPIEVFEHRYDWHGLRDADGACVFWYAGLHRAPSDHAS